MQIKYRNTLLHIKLQSYKKICIKCGRSNGLQPTNPEFYPHCNDPHVTRTKRKSSTKNDFISKKKQKTLSYNGVM